MAQFPTSFHLLHSLTAIPAPVLINGFLPLFYGHALLLYFFWEPLLCFCAQDSPDIPPSAYFFPALSFSLSYFWPLKGHFSPVSSTQGL